eukprot:3250141-Rhodomonas_salina.1
MRSPGTLDAGWRVPTGLDGAPRRTAEIGRTGPRPTGKGKLSCRHSRYDLNVVNHAETLN